MTTDFATGVTGRGRPFQKEVPFLRGLVGGRDDAGCHVERSRPKRTPWAISSSWAARTSGTRRPVWGRARPDNQGYSHTSDGDPSACVKRSISDYLVDLVTPPRGTVCPSNRQPFDPNFGQPLP
jgi:hypothetical protein